MAGVSGSGGVISSSLPPQADTTKSSITNNNCK